MNFTYLPIFPQRWKFSPPMKVFSSLKKKKSNLTLKKDVFIGYCTNGARAGEKRVCDKKRKICQYLFFVSIWTFDYSKELRSFSRTRFLIVSKLVPPLIKVYIIICVSINVIDCIFIKSKPASIRKLFQRFYLLHYSGDIH